MVESPDSFAAALLALMRRRRLSGPKLETMLRVSDSAIYEWTSGRIVPPYLTVVGLAKILRWPDAIAIADRDRSGRPGRRSAVAAAVRA